MKSICLFFAFATQLLGAIGCTLTNPAQDLKYLFPEMTTYKEDLYEFPRLKDGRELFGSFKQRLGGDLDPIYETYETSYTVYSVFQGRTRIGIVHGVNVPGKGGVIQVFLSMDPAAEKIRALFFQRLESPAARQLRDKGFRAQFEGMTPEGLARVKAPELDARGRADYDAALRGVKKNLILLDLLVYGRK
jgi:hypothetical protein